MCINYASLNILSTLIVLFIPEYVDKNDIGRQLMIMFIFYSIGCILNGVLFSLFSWENILLFYFLGTMVSVEILLRFYVKETPFDLITRFTPAEAYEDLNWIAK